MSTTPEKIFTHFRMQLLDCKNKEREKERVQAEKKASKYTLVCQHNQRQASATLRAGDRCFAVNSGCRA